ncbi:MAG: conjugal transfer protein TraC, partial [Nitrospirae bacterium]
MLNTILNAIFGSNGGMKLRDIKKTLQRIHFSDYLPWIAYDEETEVFVNKDETAGFIWECSPICFAGEQTAGTLKGLLNMGLPHGSIMQFILYADHDIEPFLSDYKSKKTVSHPLIKTAVDRFCSFLSSGTEGLENLQGTPVRNFRLFLSIKFPISAKVDINEIKTFTEEILRGAYLHPRLLRPEDLLLWMRRYFNTTASKNDKNYNETIPISKQIILSETDIKTSFTSIKVGERTFKCMTPKSFPYEIDLLSTNKIFGGIWGIISDSDQINAPFLYTLNIFFQDLKKSLHAKCNLIIQQQGFGSFAPSLQRKKEEYLWATEELDKGTPFVKIIPIIWTWSRDEKKVNSALSRIRRIWESQGYIMQADKGILPILFISALPFGLYNKGKNIETMERDFITPIDTLSVLFPIQSDFSGGGDPLMLFVGRKGQICPLNIFDPSATNHNIFIAAGTGGGKSFLVNSMVFNHYSAG